MRKIYRNALVIGTSLCGVLPALVGATAHAQTGGPYYDQSGQPIFLPNSSSSYNQQGFNLPSMPSQGGQDIVRGSGGISCQAAIGHGGPKLDMGVIGSNDIFERSAASVYGRVTIPLGKRPKRVDCSKLYDLEISRLKMELQLMRAGAMRGMSDPDTAKQVALQAGRGQLPAPQTFEAPPEHSLVRNKPLIIGSPPGTKPKSQELVIAVNEKPLPPVVAKPVAVTADLSVKAPPAHRVINQEPVPPVVAKPVAVAADVPVNTTPAHTTVIEQPLPPVVATPVTVAAYVPVKPSPAHIVVNEEPQAPLIAQPVAVDMFVSPSDAHSENKIDLAQINLPRFALGVVTIASYGKATERDGYYAQVGEFSSLENAKTAWWNHSENVPSVFTDYSTIVKPVRNGVKTHFVLQAGPFSERDTKGLCKLIGNGCNAVPGT